MAEREGVNVLCMAPTEYRAVAKRTAAARAARRCGTPSRRASRSTPRSCALWRDAGRDRDPRRLRPDRDRRAHRDADRPAGAARARWASPSPASTRLDRRRRAVRRPRHGADLLPRRPGPAPWRTGDRVRQDEDGYLWFEGRTDDVIISVRLPDRAVRGRVGARLAPRGGRGGRGRRARRGARIGGARGRGPARGARARARARPRAPGARQGGDGALQVPAHRRVRRRAAEDREREDQACGAAASERARPLRPAVRSRAESDRSVRTSSATGRRWPASTSPARGIAAERAACAA